MVEIGAPNKPRLFICSSAEGRDVAEAIQFGLDRDTEVEVWHQDIFKLSDVPLDSLETAVRTIDFAAIVVTPDDVTTKRGVTHVVPRDNVVFELGMFVGALGRRRTFIVMPRDEDISLPTDLSGLAVSRYAPRSDGNLIAAVGTVCTQMSEDGHHPCWSPTLSMHKVPATQSASESQSPNPAGQGVSGVQ